MESYRAETEEMLKELHPQANEQSEPRPIARCQMGDEDGVAQEKIVNFLSYQRLNRSRPNPPDTFRPFPFYESWPTPHQQNATSNVNKNMNENATLQTAADQIEIKHGDSRGMYKVHPVAALFPLMEGERLADLKKSIQERGQQDPVVIDDRTFLDGRNRLAALNELGWAPKIVQFKYIDTKLSPGEWIVTRNLERRHLTDDQRLALATKCHAMLKRKQARRSVGKEVGCPPSGDDDGGAETGAAGSQALDRPSTSEFPPESAEIPATRKKGRPPGQRSDAKEVAAKTGQSRNRADWMFTLQKSAPELFNAVGEGKLKLKDAISQFKAAHPDKLKAKKAPEPDQIAKVVEKAGAWLRREASRFADAEQIEFWRLIAALANGMTKTANKDHQAETSSSTT